MADDEGKRIEHDGRTFVVLESGEGPLVVLFHGFPDHPAAWDGIRERLVDAGFRTIAPFLRGYHPDTIVEGRGYGAREIAEDALALLDALDAPSATLVGHDWGASVVYGAAALAPDRVDAVVPVGIPHPAALKPTPALAWSARHLAGFKAPWGEALARRNGLAYIDTLYRRWSPNWIGSDRDASVRRAQETLADPVILHHALEYYRALSPKRPEALDRPITSPTLIVGGGGETQLRTAYEASCAEVDATCDLLLVPGAGHWPHREDEAQFTDRLVAFLTAGAS